MLYSGLGSNRPTSLMGEYAMLLGDAVLRHRTNIAEQSARVEAEVASRVKSEFIANMSHELRTPLNSIIGFSKMLAESDRRPLPVAQTVEYATLINDAAMHLLSVINDILDISKLQSGHYRLDLRPVALDEILTMAAASLKLSADELDVRLKLEIPNHIGVVHGDPVKLRQIVTNLVSNAIKFSKSGGNVRLRVETASDHVLIDVIDTGVGMTPDEVKVALMPFGQVDGGKTRWREGTGLGLPIARSLTELHGGELTVDSVKGEGTRVRVLLPRTPET